ncbi:hypothetical protein [Nitrincola sp.]|uniref:hypothetical protein n=1 Tax=Nitrincola sp. TaxID=1926584 RepID=UPI003A95DB44
MLGASIAFPLLAEDEPSSDTPFQIEDFAPDSGRYTVTGGIGYNTSDSRNINVSTTAIPIAHGYALLLPEVIVDDRRRDTLFATLGLRYAFNQSLNLNLGLKGDTSRSLIQNNNETSAEYDSGWRTISAGFDYRFTQLYDQPYVLGFAEIAIAERNDGATDSGKTATFGASSHWAFDPVILSLTGTYTHLRSRKIKGKQQNPGDIFGIGMSIGLAMNPEISFRAGVNQSFRTNSKTTNQQDYWNASTAFTLGYVQRLTPSLAMNINAQGGVAGNHTAQISTSFTWRPN